MGEREKDAYGAGTHAMTGIYRHIDRISLNQTDPERAHGVALRSLSVVSRSPGGLRALRRVAPPIDERLRVRLFGLPFPNPIGVAAGLDKNGVAVDALLAIGFGHVEVGTVTLLPQPGNDKPRLWRVPGSEAVINSLGFPSDGAANVRNRLRRYPPNGIAGVNIGKNLDIPAERAAAAYADLTRVVADVASYITVNVSSPNTPGLRALQMSDDLAAILAAVSEANGQVASARKQQPKPILVKLSPDLTREEIEAVAWTAVSSGASGIVATNTTTGRDGISEEYRDLPGGLSGRPLRDRANQVVKTIYQATGNQLPIIGAGGISSAKDVIERIKSGASLVQLYTAFVYAGPGLPAAILRDLSGWLDESGVASIGDLVGQAM